MKIWKTLSLLILFLTVFSCNKEHLTSTELGELASKKRQEIQNLIAKKTATNVDEWYVKKAPNYWCGNSYFPMHKSLEKDFDKLWKEYHNLVSQEVDAGIKEGIIYEPCEYFFWYQEEPIRLIIENNVAKLILASDLSVEESQSMLPELEKKIQTYNNNLQCTGTEKWETTGLIDGCNRTFLLYQPDKDYSEIKKIVGLYNALNMNIFNKLQTSCGNQANMQIETITCENNKPVIHYKK
ncbi:hypothetical protein LZQ00_17670 [Sphingobacterium sp. SRCM116780]|uniref:hypothetical protein n=1 Tax=Sphingobacterium sp. SRCM116780 TaxID=2907623 RepID=UPI001F181638|nr:hypothetical protein [Sphingobacterium sp. SRCM116780]UIR56079.1 hypothetical protein LZQ00_17670 [Sphingobacterium sp. SRCM116780]